MTAFGETSRAAAAGYDLPLAVAAGMEVDEQELHLSAKIAYADTIGKDIFPAVNFPLPLGA